MKNKYLFATVLTAAMAINANAALTLPNRPSAGEIIEGHPIPVKTNFHNVNAKHTSRSATEPVTEFVADTALVFYYGDFVGNGTETYYLVASNGKLADGFPVGECQMMRLLLISDSGKGGASYLPSGTYPVAQAVEDFEKSCVVPDESEIMDVFLNPENPQQGDLYFYSYTPLTGYVTINRDDKGVYTIEADFTEMVLFDEDYEVLDERSGSCSYTGTMDVKDPYAYNPLEGDTELDIQGVSGRYIDGEGYGEYNISFYNVALDAEGYIVGPGQLFNLDLFTEYASPMNLDMLVGDYEGVDAMENGPIPGYFAEGMWYEIWPGYFMPIGTTLSIYQVMGEVPRECNIGLCVYGTTKITKGAKDGDYKFVFDYMTYEGHSITGEWEGPIGDYVSDFSTNSGVANVSTDRQVAISGGVGCIKAPADAQVCNLAGTRCGTTDLVPGIYIVKSGRAVRKVVVR